MHVKLGRYAVVFYTNYVLEPWQGGVCFGPIVFIRPKYYGVDRGILEHELLHSRQCFRPSWWFRPLIEWEVAAYKEQAKWYPDDRIPRFAVSISTKYGFNVSVEEAERMLRA